MTALKRKFRTKTTKFAAYEYPMLKFEYKNKRIGAIQIPGIGAPHIITVVEELIALGAKYFIALGYAGGLQKHAKPGSLILASKAIRDEGTSYHYGKPSKYSYPSSMMNDLLEISLRTNKLNYIKGPTWTTDAPYRETIVELKQFKKEGVLTVEMEASALFAVAECRKVHLSVLLTISDTLTEKKWMPKFHAEEIKQAFKKMIQVAADAFGKI